MMLAGGDSALADRPARPDFDRLAPPENLLHMARHMGLVELETDVLIAGGGIAGVCAAVAAVGIPVRKSLRFKGASATTLQKAERAILHDRGEPAAQLAPGVPYQGRRSQSGLRESKKEQIMLHYAVVFLVLALIAAVFGFGGVAVAAAGIAKILFFLFLIGFVISLVVGRRSV